MTQKKSDGLLYMVAIFLATLVLASTVRHARSQPFYGDIYDGARQSMALWRAECLPCAAARLRATAAR